MKIVRLVSLQVLLLLIVAALLVGADRLTGRLMPSLRLAKQLFPPNSVAVTRTPEFNFTAHINGAGFRDRDFGAPKPGLIRAIAIGDSFTYGWGVPLKNTWVKRLELGLRAQGVPIEIADLGKPGSGPAQYAAVAQAATPVLRPRYVLVALQQTDDLQQAVPDPVFVGLLKGLGHATLATRAEGLLRRAFPNFIILLSRGSVEHVKWGPTVARIMALLTDSERRRFEDLDPEVRHMFLSGELNPGLLVIAAKSPRYYVKMTDPSTPHMRERIRAMTAQLEFIKRAARQVGADVIVVSVPNRGYVSKEDLANVKRLGFETRDGMEDWTSPDDAIREVAARAGLRAIFVTDGFRRACRKVRCYFTFDDHLNETGHRIYAQLLTGALYNLLHTPKESR